MATLEPELALYRSLLPDLLGFGYAGQWAVIGRRQDDPEATPVRLIGIYPTWEAGLEAGYGELGLGPWLVKRVERVETVHRI